MDKINDDKKPYREDVCEIVKSILFASRFPAT